MFPQEPRQHENQNIRGRRYGTSRTKIGLETPISGRFWGENKRLLFAPAKVYDLFVFSVTVGGFAAGILGFFRIMPTFIVDDFWWTWVGFAVCGAGILAYMSSERMTIDLRQRHYWRREGAGPFKRFTRGSLAEIDALVLQASEYPAPQLSGRTVIYRLVLFWKNGKEPLMVVEKFVAAVPISMPMNAGNAVILQKGMRFAKEMQIPFYDNSHFPSPDAQRFI